MGWPSELGDVVGSSSDAEVEYSLELYDASHDDDHWVRAVAHLSELDLIVSSPDFREAARSGCRFRIRATTTTTTVTVTELVNTYLT